MVSNHGVLDLFYHFWLRWTHWSSACWYFQHGGMMWDVWPRTVYQPVANTQAIQFDASTLQVGDLYDLCRCLRFFTTFAHRHPHYVNIHQFCSRCGPWWYSNQLGIWQFQRETLRHRTDFYCSCAVLAVPRMLKVMLVLVGPFHMTMCHTFHVTHDIRRTVEAASGQYVVLDCTSGCTENSTAYLAPWMKFRYFFFLILSNHHSFSEVQTHTLF